MFLRIKGSNPGVGFRPLSKNIEEGSLIWYNSTSKKQTDSWEENLNDFLTRKRIKILSFEIDCTTYFYTYSIHR